MDREFDEIAHSGQSSKDLLLVSLSYRELFGKGRSVLNSESKQDKGRYLTPGKLK